MSLLSGLKKIVNPTKSVGKVTTGMISPIISGISSMIGSNMASTASAAAYERQIDFLNRQQNFIREMSNTSHQREIADLKAAGLNPLLTVMGGNGASVTSASGGSVPIDDKGEIFNTATNNFANSVASAYNAITQRQLNDANIELLNEKSMSEIIDRVNKNVDTDLKRAQVTAQQIENEYLPEKRRTEIENNISNTMTNAAKSQELTSAAGVNEARKVLLESEKAINDEILEIQRNKADWIRKHPHLAEFAEGIRQFEPVIHEGGAITRTVLSGKNAENLTNKNINSREKITDKKIQSNEKMFYSKKNNKPKIYRKGDK